MITISILGISLFSGNIPEATRIVLDVINMEKQGKKNRLITATNAHGLVISKHNRHFKEILNESYLNLPDGMPTVWLGKLKGKMKIERCYGPDFFTTVIKKTSEFDIKHFLCGGKNGIAEKLKEFCQSELNNNNIVGTYAPPFVEMNDVEIKMLASKINEVNTDILWLGLSCPKQEFLAHQLKKLIRVHFIITVGAAFDFHTGNVKQAPKWIQNIGMEWLFRLFVEPKRLWKRYFKVVPLFIYFNFLEFLRNHFITKSKYGSKVKNFFL